MKADTFAKLVTLQTLLDAEVGHYLEHLPRSPERFREGLVSRISDLVDQIDALDAVAAARVYDAIVDFLAELPDDDEGVVEATLRFKRALNRLVERGMEARDLARVPTWATVLDELLETLEGEYRHAIGPRGEIHPHEYLRARFLLARSRAAADRMLWTSDGAGKTELDNGMDRLFFAVQNRRLPPSAVEPLIRESQRIARRYRPSTLTEIGAFVVRQILRRRETPELRSP